MSNFASPRAKGLKSVDYKLIAYKKIAKEGMIGTFAGRFPEEVIHTGRLAQLRRLLGKSWEEIRDEM
jgi:flagellar motor component MotA